jgi:uncharacterized protein with ParB-like and HNH nuclease domain
MAQALDKNIINVSQLLQLPNLTIPTYQRPYKWTVRNINQLFQDLDVHQKQSAYRLGRRRNKNTWQRYVNVTL